MTSEYERRAGALPERVLTIRLGAVGDVLTTLPAVQALRSLLPRAKIYHLVEEGAADAIRGLSALDDVIVVPRAQISREAKRLSFRTFSLVRRELRARRIDFVVDFQNLLRSAVWKWASGADHGVVRRHWRELSPIAFDFRVPTSANDNVVLQHGELLKVLTPDGKRPALKACPPAIDDAAWRTAREVVRASRLGSVYGVIAPGSRWPRRSLPKRIIVAAAKAMRRIGWEPLIIGGPNERGWIEPIASEVGAPFSVDLPLKPLFALIADAAGIVCADSGPLHAADMFERPTVAVFGPSAPELYGPAFAPAVVVRDERYAGQHSFRGKDIDYFEAVGDREIDAGVERMIGAMR